MSQLEKCRAKYGFKGGSYEPNPSCKFCKGIGERIDKQGRERFCICLFVEPDLSNFAGETLAATAKKICEEMES